MDIWKERKFSFKNAARLNSKYLMVLVIKTHHSDRLPTSYESYLNRDLTLNSVEPRKSANFHVGSVFSCIL
jgi:hypothetical protein